MTTFSPKSWSAGGHFSLDGRDYDLRSNMWGNTYALVADDETPVATAERVGRRRWSVHADGTLYEFRRVSFWTWDQALMVDGREAGVIKRVSAWKADATAELPGLALPLQVFVLAVVLTMWRRQSAAAAAG